MLKPIIEAALKYAGKPRANVVMCQDASQRGDSTVIDAESIRRLIEDYPLFDVYFLCVDRDCRTERLAALAALEDRVNGALQGKRFIAVCGQEELEVWILAGATDLPANWQDVRSHCDPKEAFYTPYATRRGVQDTPGRGRKVLGEEAALQYSNRIRKMCDEVQRCEQAETTPLLGM